jgi:hypothetical protein
MTSIAWRGLVLGCLLALPQQALAWGPEGHSIVAEIAQRRLSKEASDAIAKLFNPDGTLPAFSLPSLASAGSWADDFRDGHPETGDWHFIDAPLNGPINWPQDCGSACVVSKLNDLKREVRCETDRDKKIEDLKFAVHLVGDVHQPLHTVKEEVGGNTIHVHMLIAGDICKNKTCLVANEWQNLHQVWDVTLITKSYWSWGAYVDGLEKGWLATADVAKEQQGEPLDWANETHAIAKDVWVPDAATLDDFYYRKVRKKLDAQLGRAGLRLARYLNDIYAAPACPAQ